MALGPHGLCWTPDPEDPREVKDHQKLGEAEKLIDSQLLVAVASDEGIVTASLDRFFFDLYSSNKNAGAELVRRYQAAGWAGVSYTEPGFYGSDGLKFAFRKKNV